MPPKGKKSSDADEAYMFVHEDFRTIFGGAKNSDIDRSKQSHVQRQSFARRKRGSQSTCDSVAASTSTADRGASWSLQSSVQTDPGLRSEASSSYFSIPMAGSVSLPVFSGPVGSDLQVDALSPRFDFESLVWTPLPSAVTSKGWVDNHISGTPRSEMSIHGPVSKEVTSHTPQQRTKTNNASDSSQAVVFPEMPATDPFHNMLVALQLWVPPLMAYYTRSVLPQYLHTELKTVSLHDIRHAEAIHADFRSCMANPSEMYSLLAASAHHWIYDQCSMNLPGVEPGEHHRVAVMFKSRALESLQARLVNGEISPGIVMTFQKLNIAIWHDGDVALTAAHSNATFSVLRQLGGLGALNDLQKEQMIQTGLFNAMMAQMPPMPDLLWDPGDFPQDLEFDVYKSVTFRAGLATGERVAEAIDFAGIGSWNPLARILSELVETQQVLEWIQSQPYRPTEWRWFTHRRLAIFHKVLGDTAVFDSGPNTAPGLEQFVRLSAVCFLILDHTVGIQHGVVASQHIVPALRNHTAQSLARTFAGSPALSAWVIAMLGLVLEHALVKASADKELQHARRLLCKALGTSCLELGISHQAGIKNLLHTFLFSRDMIDDCFAGFIYDGTGITMD